MYVTLFLVLDTYFFIIFNSSAGNVLVHPLVPLAAHNSILVFLPSIGKTGYLCIIILFSILALYSIKKYMMAWLIVCIGCFMVTHGLRDPKTKKPAWLKKIAAVIPLHKNLYNSHDCAEHILFLLDDLKKKFPNVECILLPESTFPYALNTHKPLLRLFKDFPCLIIGSHRLTDEGLLHNTLYFIHYGTIHDSYDKKDLFYFTEYIPFPWNFFQFF